jgi:outer membrane protein
MRFTILIPLGLIAGSAFAQLASFPKPSYFRETFSKNLPRVELQQPARLQDFVQSDKLELSLKAYLELVIANNTDIAIQKLSVETAGNAITRAFAPFDPLATARFTSTRTKTPSTQALEGASTLVTLNQPANFSYSQTLPSGTQYTVNFSGSKNTTNSGFSNFNPALNSNFGINFSQPLIKNRGAYINRLVISQAKSRLRKTEYDLRDTVNTLVTNAENAYWDLILARENLKVSEKALELAKAALDRAQKELDLGAMSPLDIYQPQQVYATAEIAVSQAQFTLRQTQNALRKQIGADLDVNIRKLPIELTETVLPPSDSGEIDAEASVERALANRPDLKSANQNLDIDELQIRRVRNDLLPDLSLLGTYTTQGRGGVFYRRTNVFNDTGGINNILEVTPGGFGDALSQMWGFGFPVYAFGLQLRLPIRNRAASADLADALISKKRDMLSVRNVQQQVRLDILQAVSQVEASKASVKLAQVALDFAQKRLDAEQKKYELGTSQIYFVLQAQQDLVTAQNTLVQQSVLYRRNQLNLLRREGTLLDERGHRIYGPHPRPPRPGSE